MSRTAVESDIRETLGLVPEFLTEIPDSMIETEWASFKEFELAETAIPNRIGYFTAALLSAVSGSEKAPKRPRSRAMLNLLGSPGRLDGIRAVELASYRGSRSCLSPLSPLRRYAERAAFGPLVS
jgi:hypothetical protein